MENRDLDRVLEDVVGSMGKPAQVENTLPPRTKDVPCLGCGRTMTVKLAVGFPMCKPCDQRWGPDQTWEERIAIHSRRKTLDQVIKERGRVRFGEVTDRLHVPAIFGAAKANTEVAEWAAQPRRTLILHGPTGTGKSYQATGAMRAYLEAREGDGYLVNCASLGRMSRDEFHVFRGAAILALDDLGARITAACLASAYELIEARLSHRKPLIVTTNITPAGVFEIDDRIGSRLGGGQWIAMTGLDRRLESA